MTTLSKKTSAKIWQLQGALILLEEERRTFDEIIFRATSNYLDLIKEDADKKYEKLRVELHLPFVREEATAK